VIATAAVAVVVLAATATAMARSAMDARERERNARMLEQAAASRPATPSVIMIHSPVAAPLPTTRGSSTAARIGDTTVPAGRAAATGVSPELKQPIEELKGAIESGLATKIEEVYKAYDHDDSTKRFFKGIIDHADSIHVKSIAYRSSNITGNVAELRYRMTLSVTAPSSKVPTSDVPSSWRADLVRESQKGAWKIRKLTQIRF
jgi:hypothetical protein